MSKLILALGLLNLVLIGLIHTALAQNLQVGFYNTSCPQAESVIKGVVARHFLTDKSIPAALTRMHFHDCFVRGCDASILIDSKGNNVSEKEAVPNLTVRGYEIIDEAKAELEMRCRGIVSCADVIAVAARDAVALARGPSYNVNTGRRDGRISSKDEVDLPGSSWTISQATAAFVKRGLDLQDMVTLLGAHTVGISHCVFFSDRLYDFQGSGKADPSMDPTLVKSLKAVCPLTTPSTTEDPSVFLDQNTSFLFDNSYYKQLGLKRGILQIDQELALDSSSRDIVTSFASNGVAFGKFFGDAMIKLGSVGVLTGQNGEIRSSCRVVNPIAPGEPSEVNPSTPGNPEPNRGIIITL